MKILFICKKIKKHGISPIMQAQRDSLLDENTQVDFFLIDIGGIKSYLKAILKLRLFLKKNKYDILHAHYSFSGFVALLARSNQKLVVSFMGSDINNKSYFLGFLNNILIKYSNHIIAKSSEMSQKIFSNKKTIIPNGVNVEIFKPFSKIESRKFLNLEPHKKYILFVSDPPSRKEKNIQLLKKAVDEINDDNIEILAISGVSQEILSKYYSAVDLLALTSLKEGSPNVIKEAMACNCPIVATNVGDVNVNLKNVENCYVSNFNENEISNYIKKIIARENIRTNGRDELFRLGLDKKSIAFNIKSIYKNLTL
jgi:glycosyltransferase involved in cell wall biosynthesis